LIAIPFWVFTREFKFIGLAVFFLLPLMHYFFYDAKNNNEYYYYYNLGLTKPKLWISTIALGFLHLVILFFV